MSDAAKILILLGVVPIFVSMIASCWRIFEKAGHIGFLCLIPFYNIYVMLSIAGMSGWWVLLMFFPYVKWIVIVVMTFRVASAFRKDSLFAIGMLVLPFVFYPLLAYRDDERYYGV